MSELSFGDQHAVWRRRGYQRFLIAAVLARVSNEMLVVAVVLLLLEQGSPALAGATVAAVTLPGVVTGPLLGAWLDRTPSASRALALDQGIAAVALTVIAYGAGAGLGPLVLLPALVAGVTFPLSAAGFTTLIPRLVAPSHVRAADAIEAASFNVAAIVGPALAGTVALAASPVAAVLVQAVLKLVALFLLALAPEPPRGSRPAETGLLRGTLAGAAYVLRTRRLLAVTVAGALALGGRGILVVAFPLLAATRLGSVDVAGYLWSAFAAGCVIGALGATRIRTGDSLRLALGGTGVAGALLVAFPLVSSLPVGLALGAAAGIAYGPALAATLVLRHESTPPHLYGSVLMTSASIKPACLGIGAVAAAPLLGAIGLSAALAAAGGAHIAGAAAGAHFAGRSRAGPSPGGSATRLVGEPPRGA